MNLVLIWWVFKRDIIKLSWRSLNIWEVWFLAFVLRYKDGDIRVMLVSNCDLVRMFVLRFVIPESCTYGLSLCYEIGAWFIFYFLPYEWRSGMSDGLFLPIYPPRGMRSSTLLQGLNFCNKYVSSLWLTLSSWINALSPFHHC